MEQSLKIILLGGTDDATRIVYHALNDFQWDIIPVIELPPSRKKMLRSRLKRLGWVTVLGQLLFQTAGTAFLRWESRRRRAEIHHSLQLDSRPIPNYYRVTSVNDEQTRILLQEIQPDIVIVNGTRIIGRKTLHATEAPFVNTHVGITPKYRGVHGGYWALVNGDSINCGVTVHLLDEGIDTGNILYQAKVTPTNTDNFATYPLLQLAGGIKLLHQVLLDMESGGLTPRSSAGESKLYYHPTLGQYLYYRWFKGVK